MQLIETTSKTSRGARTRQRLLDAARALLIEGDGALELADVAQRANVSPGLPYRYFESKSALVVSIVDAFYDDLERASYHPTFEEVSDDWWERERARVRRMVDFFYENPLSPLIVSGLAGDADVMLAQRTRMVRHQRGAAANIDRGKALGKIPHRLPSGLTAAFLMAGMHQGLRHGLLESPRRDRAELSRDLFELMGRVLCIEN